jgi:beta-phosphoglucomutase-like phosphatase (HAD superfamily)
VGICSAATKGGFDKLVNAIVGPERLSKLDVVMAGDDVKKKKPDPMIYNMAKEKINVPAER